MENHKNLLKKTILRYIRTLTYQKVYQFPFSLPAQKTASHADKQIIQECYQIHHGRDGFNSSNQFNDKSNIDLYYYLIENLFDKYTQVNILYFMINEAKDKKCKYFNLLRGNENYKLKLTKHIFYNAKIKDENGN